MHSNPPNKIIFEEECPQFTNSSHSASPTHSHPRVWPCFDCIVVLVEAYLHVLVLLLVKKQHAALASDLHSHGFSFLSTVEGEPILKAGSYPHSTPSPFDLGTKAL